MKPKQRLRVGFPGMAHCGVPAAAAIDILAPRNWVITAHRSAGIGRFIEARQDMNGTAGIAAEIVPFVGPLPACRQVLGRRVIGVLDADRRVLDLRMAGEPGADEAAVPRPVILGIARRMDADKSAARADVAFERSLMLLIEDVPGRAEEHDNLVLRERRVGETPGVFRVIHSKAVLGAERPDGGDAVRYRVVTKPSGLGED